MEFSNHDVKSTQNSKGVTMATAGGDSWDSINPMTTLHHHQSRFTFCFCVEFWLKTTFKKL